MTEVRETLAEGLRNIGIFLALALSSCVRVGNLFNLYASVFSSGKWEWYSCLEGDFVGLSDQMRMALKSDSNWEPGTKSEFSRYYLWLLSLLFLACYTIKTSIRCIFFFNRNCQAVLSFSKYFLDTSVSKTWYWSLGQILKGGVQAQSHPSRGMWLKIWGREEAGWLVNK